jgi:glutathione S-transferase
MITLYDFLDSGNGYKVRLTLRELGQPFVYREMNILRGETQEAWFLAKNPAGEIPVLELDDGTCLRESTAILTPSRRAQRNSRPGGPKESARSRFSKVPE